MVVHPKNGASHFENGITVQTRFGVLQKPTTQVARRPQSLEGYEQFMPGHPVTQ